MNNSLYEDDDYIATGDGDMLSTDPPDLNADLGYGGDYGQSPTSVSMASNVSVDGGIPSTSSSALPGATSTHSSSSVGSKTSHSRQISSTGAVAINRRGGISMAVSSRNKGGREEEDVGEDEDREGEDRESGGDVGNDEKGEDGEGGRNNQPHIVLMGLKRSGKTSIVKVVFSKLSPHETRHLESTKSVERNRVGGAGGWGPSSSGGGGSSFVNLEVWDFPGQLEWDPAFDDSAIFGPCGALVWVIDAQEECAESLKRMLQTVQRAHAANPAVLLEVFVHKADGLSEDHKVECQRDIIRRCGDVLHDAGLDGVPLTTHTTSIYDHSVFEAFSKVIQKLTPQLSTLNDLLECFTEASGVERAFLADVATKIELSGPQAHAASADSTTTALCSDMIDVVSDMMSIYEPIPSQQQQDASSLDPDELLEPDPKVESVIHLTDGMVLYLRAVNRFLVMVAVLKESSFAKRGLIDYNFQCLRKALVQVLHQGASPKP